MTIAEGNAPIPVNLKRIIKERGLKQNVVAKWAGYTNHQLTDMLNGRKFIKPCDVASLANVLGVDVGELFVETSQSSI